MACFEEVAQLAHMLRVSAETARLVAGAQRVDAATILDVARQVEMMADKLDEIARTSNVVPLLNRR